MTILVRLDVFGLLKILLPKINISNLNTLLQRIYKFSTVQNLKFCLKIQKFQEITPTVSRFFENFRPYTNPSCYQILDFWGDISTGFSIGREPIFQNFCVRPILSKWKERCDATVKISFFFQNLKKVL